MRRTALFVGMLAAVATMGACMTQGGRAWVEDVRGARDDDAQHGRADVEPLTRVDPPLDPAQAGFPPLPEGSVCEKGEGCDEGAIVVRDYGSGARAVISDALPADLFRNTYYDFPAEGAGAKDATLYDAACKPITTVPRDFHDRVCVQGSGEARVRPHRELREARLRVRRRVPADEPEDLLRGAGSCEVPDRPRRDGESRSRRSRRSRWTRR